MIQVNCRGDRKRFPVCLPREAMRVGLICLNAGSAVFIAGKVCNGRMPLPLQGWIGLIARLLDDGQAFDVDFDGFGAAGIDFAPDFDDGVRSDLYAHETVVVDFSADGTGAVGESISFMTLFVGDFAFQVEILVVDRIFQDLGNGGIGLSLVRADILGLCGIHGTHDAGGTDQDGKTRNTEGGGDEFLDHGVSFLFD